ncbi:hypothetical protein VZT92_025317 [Zoarces viviparus]|uniref:Uncharacterized protein n=1 Tax=Zoarces viviparus TaxID=48416 RepID=A0AAW1E0R7_ZOAVI
MYLSGQRKGPIDPDRGCAVPCRAMLVLPSPGAAEHGRVRTILLLARSGFRRLWEAGLPFRCLGVGAVDWPTETVTSLPLSDSAACHWSVEIPTSCGELRGFFRSKGVKELRNDRMGLPVNR